MADPFRARAGVLHSLVAVLKKRPQSEALLARLAGKSFDRLTRLPGIRSVGEPELVPSSFDNRVGRLRFTF